ncbi:PPC domain-containing protein [Akkermansiaceae bacterium]|nr:PPC domain-containing protein [Akkermansiaceae bacterium]MDB4272894.1 PPC domain-containing protein [Akkermansiaceae bacterium]MDB4667182.1 PPC domain-containing protein [Akkermansiaceae bacterium]MDB4781677.1 PPC domain-containing protein [Akkermansiaceae bacterium]MDB4796147.1 PPC domain-containing protein [Akkermansiaceae bacterium]
MKSLLCFLLSFSSLLAFSPDLRVIVPRGGQKGTEVKVTFSGDRLFEPQEVIFYQPGIAVKDLAKGKDQRSVKATFVISPDAALGEHSMRLRCKDGVSYMRTFWVGQFPSVIEAKTEDRKNDLNDTFEAPQEISQNVTVHGVALREDADYYRVKAKKGQRLSVEIEGLRLGRLLFDPYVAILDKNRFEIASNDDSALLKRDCATSVIIPEDGAYTILVRESAYEGDPRFDYRLHVGDFPRPMSVFPPAGKPGEKIELTFTGDPTGPIKQAITLPASDFSAHAVSGTSTPSALPIRVSPLVYLNEVEPNESSKAAFPKENLPAAPVAFHGILATEGDVDWFRFEGKKDQSLRIQVFARSIRSPLDSVIAVRSLKTNKAIANNDDQTQGVPDSRLDFKVPEDGHYVINIKDQLGRSGPDFVYRIEIAPREPAISVALRPAERNDSQKYKMISVPRGNRLIVVPGVTRSSIGCELDFTHAGLPAGLKMTAPHVAKNLNEFPVLFEAAADAPLASTLATFTVKDPKSGLTGPFKETIEHVALNNLGVFHSYDTEKIAVAVIDEAPFSLDLFVPPVPLVPKGTIDLKITATKMEGFDEKIRVIIPWKPPGVNAPNSVEIPKGKNEVILTLNANGDAPVGDWMVGVTATAEAKDKLGEIRLSSQLKPLKVGEPFLDLAIEMAATNPGKNTQVIAKFDQLKPFKGEAQLILHALPHGVTAAPMKIKADTKEISIPVTVADDASKGKHANLFCQVIISENGHPIAHNLGHGGTLRIDPPPPAPKKKEEPKKPAQVVKKEEPKKAAPKKPLSRLEQLRQNKAQ